MADSHLARLGRHPRPAGGAGAAAAQEYCAEVLRSYDFVITKQSFEFSKFPGAWAAPVAGVAFPAWISALYVARHRGPSAIGLVATGMIATAILLWWIGRNGVLALPVMRAGGSNLEAARGSPRVWLVAHIDSKWQPVSMIARILGVIGSSTAMIVFAVTSIAGLEQTAVVALAATWLFAVPLMLSVVGARNDGTLDNASGVATVLEALEQMPRHVPVGVLITDAEELALAGASAWADARQPGVAINVDSIDDDGPLVVMHTGSRSKSLISRLATAASSEGEEVRALRLIPGILTDHVALAGKGWTTLTLSRGTFRTLQRIHTSRDTLAHMTGRGVSGAARVLARTISELT